MKRCVLYKIYTHTLIIIFLNFSMLLYIPNLHTNIKHTHTHNKYILQIIGMENNCIRACGTFSEIENNDPELAQQWNLTIANENSSDVQLR